jgi:hypothetical protein
MAESVKRRVAAARLAVAFVAAGTIAGAAAWAEASPPPAGPAAHSSAFEAYLKIKNLTGANIRDHSLFYKDLKHGQVPSQKQFAKLRREFVHIEKVVFDNQKSFVKQSDLAGYVKLDEADQRYVKLTDSVVRGDGSVFTASKVVPAAGSQEALLDVPGMFTVDAMGPTLTFTNTGSSDLLHTLCSGGVGTDIPIQPGKTLTCEATQESQGVQLIDGNGKVATVNFSAITFSGNVQATVQILIGL